MHPSALVLPLGLVPAAVLKVVEGIDLDVGDLERIQDVHRDSVGPLVREMPPNPRAQPLVRLTDVDGLAIVIVEHVYAALGVARHLAALVRGVQKLRQFLPNRLDVMRRLRGRHAGSEGRGGAGGGG